VITKNTEKNAEMWGILLEKMYNARLMVTCSGSLATISCEPRQVRKEATVAVISGAEVRLGQVTTLYSLIYLSNYLY
jgi:hypothetical protein